jgi:uncharacterized coiled-coil protein SlyX
MAAEVVGLAEKKLRIFAGMNDDISKRFERIEAHVAHLEHQVEQLNEVVTGQDKLIELLKKQIQRQSGVLETMELERIKDNNVRPPHH